MSTMDVAGNSNREVPSFLQKAVSAIDSSNCFKEEHKFCLTCNRYTRSLTDEQLNMLLEHYRVVVGLSDVRIEQNEWKKKFLVYGNDI
jgi:hypothetical protein